MKNRHWLSIMGIGAGVLVLAGSIYFFAGHQNRIGSLSFFLERRIRNLLFLETHEPVDYLQTAEEYETILRWINFDDTNDDLNERYKKAVSRAQYKAKASELIKKFDNTGSPSFLQQAWELLNSPEFKKVDEYGFLSFYHN